MGLELSFVWAGLIAFAVLAYVVLDGFDLGVGILFPLIEGEANRDLAMNSVAPVWDGNETWLVLGGGGLFAVFPLAYAVVMPALYAPIIAMLLALVFRGVAFEFRWRTRRGKFLWDLSFFGGSLLATFAQGVALGALVQGIAVEDRAYAGGNWDWLTPFSLLTGAALVVGYTLLGASWLVMKTDGYVRMRAERAAWVSGAGTVALIGAGQPRHPVPRPGLPREVVRDAERALHHLGADAAAGRGLRLRQGPARGPRHLAVPGGAVDVRAVLHRPRHQLLPLHRAARPDDPASGGAGCEPRFPSRRRRGAGADDPRLHRLRLLGLPRQDRPRGGLPLMPALPEVLRRLLWFAGLWLAGVAALGLVALAIRSVIA